MRRLILAIAALLVIVPAGAQVLRVVPRTPPPAVETVRPEGATRIDPAATPETARAEIDRLNARNRHLRDQYNHSLADLQALRITLDEMTRAGGALVTARCAGDTLSTNTAGASEDCAASGYTCAPVSGLCRRSCQTSEMCAPGFLCDTSAERCVVYPS